MKAAQQDPQIRRLDLTGPERRLGGAVKALAQIAERYAKGAKRAMPFLARQKLRLIPDEVRLGSAPGANPDPGPCYTVYLDSPEANTWALVRLNTGAIAAIVEGSLGADPFDDDVDLEAAFGQELTVAQRALVGRVAAAIAEDYAAAIRVISNLELSPASGESLRAGENPELPKDAIYVACGFENSSVGAAVQLFIGAEVLEAAMQDQEVIEVTTGDPRMAQAVRGVTVQVIAELGSVELELGRVLSLRAGETLRLSSAVDEPVRLNVAGMYKFNVEPVVSRGQLAVQIKDRVRNET